MTGIVHRNAQHLNALISQVLQQQINLQATRGEGTFPSRVEKRTVDLRAMVEALIQDLLPLAEARYTIMKIEIPQDCTVFADPELLPQVFQNLLSNAIEYTTRGEIIVSAAAYEPEGTVRCWVRDTGTGIPPERLDKVFDKLETDPAKPGGVGLGLAIAKQIVEAHGGTISVKSKVGQGSTFEIHIPGSSQVQRAS